MDLAMTTIDFLPVRYHEQSAQRKNQIWRVAVALLFAGLIGGAAIGQAKIRRRLEAECQVVRLQYEGANAAGARLSELQRALREERASAELSTWLRHPWPRSQLVAATLTPLPAAIHLTRLQIRLNEAAATPALAPLAAPEQTDAPVVQTTAAQRDLERLREEIDSRETVIFIEGATSDHAALYAYIGDLARADLFTKAELQSVEREGAEEGLFRFKARLVARAGFGQPNGPQRDQGDSKRPRGDSLARGQVP